MHAHLWRGGSAHFTADSSRLLVASFSGQFHWFDLPDRKSETAWGYGPQGGGIQHQVGGISGDGRVIGYLGRGRQGAPLDVQHRLLDSTGADIRHFGGEYDIFAPPVVSGDGRFAALK